MGGGDSGCWPTHIGTFASTAQQVTFFTGIHHFYAPWFRTVLFFPNILGGLWIWGFFLGSLVVSIKTRWLWIRGETQSTYVLTQGNGKGCFESIQIWFDNISK